MVRPTLPAFSVAPMRATDFGLKNVLSELRTGRGVCGGRFLDRGSGNGRVGHRAAMVSGGVNAEMGRCSRLRGPGVTGGPRIRRPVRSAESAWRVRAPPRTSARRPPRALWG